jgi:hypothetical protein
VILLYFCVRSTVLRMTNDAMAHIRLPKARYEELQSLAAARGQTFSDLARQALELENKVLQAGQADLTHPDGGDGVFKILQKASK